MAVSALALSHALAASSKALRHYIKEIMLQVGGGVVEL